MLQPSLCLSSSGASTRNSCQVSGCSENSTDFFFFWSTWHREAKSLKGVQCEDASWLQNAENEQIFAGFIRLFYQHLSQMCRLHMLVLSTSFPNLQAAYGCSIDISSTICRLHMVVLSTSIPQIAGMAVLSTYFPQFAGFIWLFYQFYQYLFHNFAGFVWLFYQYLLHIFQASYGCSINIYATGELLFAPNANSSGPSYNCSLFANEEKKKVCPMT